MYVLGERHIKFPATAQDGSRRRSSVTSVTTEVHNTRKSLLIALFFILLPIFAYFLRGGARGEKGVF